MAQHKWHKEIVTWANGAEIQCKHTSSDNWVDDQSPYWNSTCHEFRIKPQPKEPQYLYVYQHETKGLSLGFAPHAALNMWKTKIVGKIKLELKDDD